MRCAYVCLTWVLGLAGCDAVFDLEKVPGRTPPDAAVIAGRWRAVAAGDLTTCAIALDDTLWCWGYNGSGQLGIGDDNGGSRTSPEAVTTATWTSVSVGIEHACGIQTDGSLWCWGDDAEGQLGQGNSTGGGSSPVPVRVGTDTWLQVTTGDDATCAIRSDNTLHCWGFNGDGQLGIDSTTSVSVPTAVYGDKRWQAVSNGHTHTCAIDDAQQMFCWGGHAVGNSAAQSPQVRPLAVTSVATWAQVSATEFFTCGVTTEGVAFCWGDNDVGGLGNGTLADSVVPVRAGTDSDWVEVHAGYTQVCGRKRDRSLWCWGDDTSGPLTMVSPSPVQITGAGAVDVIAMGKTHACRISDAALWCIGDGSTGQLGDGMTRGVLAPAQVPHPNQATRTWSEISVGEHYSCALDDIGELYCWGKNDEAALGDGTQYRRLTPVGHAGAGWLALSAGVRHACAIAGDGKAWCWGSDYGGSLGNNSGSDRQLSPVQVTFAGTFTRIAAGDHTCATDGSNNVQCWGSNDHGQVGNTTASEFTTPQQVSVLAPQQIAVGEDHSCSLATNNTLQCWGDGRRAQVGNGVQLLPQAPYTHPTMYRAVFARFDRTCAIVTSVDATNDETRCWGTNHWGSAGTGGDDPVTVPSPVFDSKTWTTLALGVSFTCGLKGSTLYCWGRNHRGQLGNGTQVNSSDVAVQVGTAAWKAISAGDAHACGLQTDNTLWCWGSNREGQLGTGAGWARDWLQVP